MVRLKNKKYTQKIILDKFQIISKFTFFYLFSQVSPGPQGQQGIRSQFATLNVLVPPEPPRILQGDFYLTAENEEIELDCISIGGKPAAKVNSSLSTYVHLKF